MELYIGICDDDAYMLDLLKSKTSDLLSQSYHPVIYTARSAEELLAQHVPFHVVLLDVQMEETDGVQLARELTARNSSCQIIFISGFLKSVSYVYEVPHVGLILKDQLDEYLPVFLKKAADFAAEFAGKDLTIQVANQTVSIRLADLAFLERNGHWTTVTLCDGRTLRTREKLAELLRRINQTGFCQCHTSYAVNLLNVRRLDGMNLVMKQGEIIPISRKFQKEFMDEYYDYLAQMQQC